MPQNCCLFASRLDDFLIDLNWTRPTSHAARKSRFVGAIALALIVSALGSAAHADSILVDTGEPCTFGACQSEAIRRVADRIHFIAQSVTIDQAATLSQIQIFGIHNPSTQNSDIRIDVTTRIGADTTTDDVIASFNLPFTDALEWQTAGVDFEIPSGEIFFVLSVEDGRAPTVPSLNFVSPVPPLADTRYFRAQQADPSPGSTLFAPGVDFREVDRTPEYAWEIGVRVVGTPKPNLPVADAGPNQDVECESREGALVRLDGSGSYDPGGDPLGYTWTNSFGTAVGVQPQVLVSLGEHRVTLKVENDSGGTDRDDVAIRIADTSPPTIFSLTSDPSYLWPPNHKMVRVSISADVADICSPDVGCRVVKVQSSEPEDSIGDGRTSPDWYFAGPLEVMLRAEASGRKAERIYTLTIACTDRERNTSRADTRISVSPNGSR